ncbi:MAG: tetratricopeptide repeat protein [Bacteroidetes bacterium]|nr:tetratricopeptide repeat protein [Bacteroidota bacterium]
MKRIVVMVLMVISISLAFGQKAVRQTASNYLKEGKLDKALESINQCIQDPSTAQDPKAWFIRGNIYSEIAITKDEKFKALEPEPLAKALESYKMATKFDEKREFTDDIFQKVNWQRNTFFNQAVDFYGKKDYKNAMLAFDHSYSALAAINIPDTLSLFYAAACATLANDRSQAKKYYIDLLKLKAKSVSIYASLSELYRQEKDSGAALAVIREGQKIYPGNMPLFLAETNIYLTFNNIDKALLNLRTAAKKDSANPSIYYALGTIYNKLVDDTSKNAAFREQMFTNAADAYKRAIELKPDYFDPIFNLGALYVNKAVYYDDKAKNLPLDAEAEYKSLKAEADKYLSAAIPYLEKATELQPNDISTLNSLKQIYIRQQKNDKIKAINEKINSVQQKK